MYYGTDFPEFTTALRGGAKCSEEAKTKFSKVQKFSKVLLLFWFYAPTSPRFNTIHYNLFSFFVLGANTTTLKQYALQLFFLFLR
jgi:hypothetical protein